MSQLPDTIPNKPVLKPALDYYRLRKDGIGFIEQMGSRKWTDYNPHDPGITILEALCYALTDLAQRTGFKIEDLLTPPTAPMDPDSPYPTQAFFTAADILTTNPWTPDDFRRLLINLETVRNAWVFCKTCACDQHYYAWCEEDQLKLSYQKSPNPQVQSQKVEPLGLYEVLVELETDPELGDLNNRKIDYTGNVFDGDNRPHPIMMELRFPEWGLAKKDAYALFLNSTDAFLGQNGASFDLKTLKFNRNKIDDTPMADPELRKHWQDVFYIDFEIVLSPGGETIRIENAALRIYGGAFVKNQTTVEDLAILLRDKTPSGFIQRYRDKRLKVEHALAAAKASLHHHRNLCEDYCRIKGVDVEDVSACADVEVAPDADIERVQAQIWFQIEQYFNPPVRFYTLQELMDEGLPVEDIFNGPRLDCGFIKADELASAGLKTVLRTSDIINRLMEIEGIIAVNHLQLTKYDAEGHIRKGSADPDWDKDGRPVFDAEKASASWLLYVTQLHQPRLYENQSRFRFYKNGLPFLPRMDEVEDILIQLRGEAERLKIKNIPHDLPLPKGKYRYPQHHPPVQNGFPLTYGIGPEGLPSHVSNLRRAQAKQMKAYLMVFEQLLGNAFAQLAHTADLFSLDATINRTYFVHAFSDSLIKGYSDIIDGLDQKVLEDLTETATEYKNRRNRFLDHLMARFGEQFSEYTLLLTNLQGRQVALDRLIDDKISFLKAYPGISKNRGKAFNHTEPPALPGNKSGLKKRVSLLLGYPDLTFSWTTSKTSDVYKVTHYDLKDQNETIWISGQLSQIVEDENEAKAIQKAYEILIAPMSRRDAYQVEPDDHQFRLVLRDEDDNPVGQHPKLFDTQTTAQHFAEELRRWSVNERAFVVEHVLLRPKFPGDALYPACTEGTCTTCGDEDPYSFRLTYIMPGWTAPFDTHLDARCFADRTMRQETPSHLLGKICWVGNDGIDHRCNRARDDLAELLKTKGWISENVRPSLEQSCECAEAIYAEFRKVFRIWYADLTFVNILPEALKTSLHDEFIQIDPNDITCTIELNAALWSEVRKTMMDHFIHIARFGFQFNRIEDTWRKWLSVNADFDWTEERLQERVQAILETHLETGPVPGKSQKDTLCQCAAAIVTTYGMDFYHWMEVNLKAGHGLADFTDFTPRPVALCPGFEFKNGTKAIIAALLKDRYEAYREVSYRLTILVNLLADLGNIYPGATLHDCDEGSDRNPVRLGSTALGHYPPKSGQSTAPP